MLQVNSPHFSNSGKTNISSLVSPTRNKRIVSAELCFSALPTQRNNNNNNSSCKKLQSPSSKIIQSKELNKENSHNRKKSQLCHIKTKSKDMIMQMSTLKQEYTSLKAMYKQLALQKMKNLQKEKKLEDENTKLREQNETILRQNENYKAKINFLDAQIDRIKKESVKLVSISQFKVKNLQENLLQKDRFIDLLKDILSANGFGQQFTKVQNDLFRISQEEEVDNKLSSLNSFNSSFVMTKFNFSKISNTSESLNISINSIKENRQLEMEIGCETQNLKRAEEVRQIEQCLGDLTNRNNEMQHKRKGSQIFKKGKGKKFELALDQRNKQQILIAPKTPTDRRIGKQLGKVGKTKQKGKKQQEVIESKSSKKK